MTKIIELRPKKDLLNPSFEKYQFSADIVPIVSEINLKTDVYRQEVSSDQESWLDARLFAFHNHLFKNPYDMSCWFIDNDWSVWKFKQDGSLEQVYTMKKSNLEARSISYNPSIGFAANKVIVVSDGKSTLELLLEDDTQNIRSFPLQDVEPGIILNVQYVPKNSTIIIVMCAITEDLGKKCTQLTLLFYKWQNTQYEAQSFEFIRKQTLQVLGTVDYVTVEENGDYLHSISQNQITFKSSQLEEHQAEEEHKDSTNVKIPRYCWSQDEDSLTVWIKKSGEYQREQTQVKVTPTEVSVIINNTVMVQGKCQHRLDETLTTWKEELDALRIELMKSEVGLMWSELIQGDTGGEYLPNETLAAEIHSRLAHLCTNQPGSDKDGQPCIGFNSEQLEECDLEGRDNVLERVNLITQKTTHLAMLGTSTNVLFTYKLKSGQAVCLRHDHDGCVWVIGSGDDNSWDVQHCYTFSGFGYVQASKTNKKFCVAPTGCSYVAVLEYTRHIFLYEKPTATTKVGRQRIVDLGCDTTPILGAVATNKHLIVLTKNKLCRLQVVD